MVPRRARRGARRLRPPLEQRLAEGRRGPRVPSAAAGSGRRSSGRASPSSRVAALRASGLKVDAGNPTGAVRLYERLGFVADEPAGGLGRDPVTAPHSVSLLRWLRRQLRQPEPLREHLEAAIQNDDPAEARRVVASSSSRPPSSDTSAGCSTTGSTT